MEKLAGFQCANLRHFRCGQRIHYDLLSSLCIKNATSAWLHIRHQYELPYLLYAICRLDVNTDWPQIAEQNLQGSFTKHFQQQLLWKCGLGPPSISDSEWQQIAENSLPAALQYHIWPVDHTVSLQSQVTPHAAASVDCVWADVQYLCKQLKQQPSLSIHLQLTVCMGLMYSLCNGYGSVDELVVAVPP